MGGKTDVVAIARSQIGVRATPPWCTLSNPSDMRSEILDPRVGKLPHFDVGNAPHKSRNMLA
jgi:hypothetical protein